MMENTSQVAVPVFSNSTLNISHSVNIPEPPRYIIVVASVMYSLIFIAGVFANLSVVIVVGAVKRVRSRMSFLFANLSLADLLVLIVCMPSAAIDLFAKEVWYLGEFMCKYLWYSYLSLDWWAFDFKGNLVQYILISFHSIKISMKNTCNYAI